MNDTDLIVQGMLPAIIIVSAALTLPISLFLLWLYRRAVLRGMRASASLDQAPQEPPSTQAVPTRGMPLAITRVNARSTGGPAPASDPVQQAAGRSLRRVVLVFVLAGLAYALLQSGGWRAMAAEGRWLSFGNLFMAASLAWPTVMAVSMIAALGRRDNLTLLGIYLALLVVVGIPTLMVNREANPIDLVVLWILFNGPATLLVSAFLTRRVRAVGPLILAFMIAGVSGALILTQAVGESPELVSFLARAGAAVGLGAELIFLLLNLAGFVALGVLGRWLLRQIGHLYRQKWMSDLSITLDALWLSFAIAQGIAAGLEGLAWAAAAFVTYKLVVWLGLLPMRLTARSEAGSPMLLLLRVFSLGRRSERLFDKLTKRWLRAGSVSLIAGPDLLTATVEPHEFLDFLGRKLSRQFVSGEEDLNRRLAEIDTHPDPDGRYRVNTFFCRADTWQMTMRVLATRSDAVLMDLRSFSPDNLGCLYELEQLLGSIPVAQFVLVVDDTTDQPFLEWTLRDLWQQVPPDSPNRGLSSPEVRVFQAQAGSGAEVRTLLRLLFGMRRQGVPSLRVR